VSADKAKPSSAADPEDAEAEAARRMIDRSRALVPAVQRVNEMRVRRGFWPFIRKIAAHAPFVVDAVALYYCARDPETPAAAKAVVIAALAWFISPFSIVQDLLAGVGFVSDAAVIAAVVGVVGTNLKPRHREAARDALQRFAAV
jgi:uncharacterized membrane protein YkvA (DUF1232 family)